MIELLKESPAPRVYMANPGNLGDALIRRGTLKYFDSIGLEYTEVRRPPGEKVGTFIYGGGGAWCKNWNNSRFVNAAATQVRQIIVLPSTYAIKSPLYEMENIHFFCRDNLDSQVYCPRAEYQKDMAFHLQDELHPIAGNGVGYFMRTDKERSRRSTIPQNNKDISLLGKTYSDTNGFINAINRVREVHTDRLHVAIVACLLQKKIYFYAGNYFKNKVVFHSCMEGNFDVTFREHDRHSLPDR